MDVLAVILACSLYPDDNLVRVLVEVQSSGNVYFVGDLTTLKSKDTLGSADAALRFAEELRAHGGRPVGLLGIPLEWASRYGRAPRDLFDACINVAVATAAMAEYEDRCSGVPPARGKRRGLRGRLRSRPALMSRQVRSILSRFARDLGVVGVPGAILKMLAHESAMYLARSVDAPARSQIFSDVPEDVAPTSRGDAGQRLQCSSRDVAETRPAAAVPTSHHRCVGTVRRRPTEPVRIRACRCEAL